MNDERFMLRLPSDLKARLVADAQEAGRSMNAEIVIAIKNHLKCHSPDERLDRLEAAVFGDDQ